MGVDLQGRATLGSADMTAAVGNVSGAGATAPPSRAFANVAWFTVAYLLLVIVFGAWVRVTGSGAGCGSDWPTCRGELVPRAPTVATVIEYSHRLTSGLLGVLIVVIAGWSWALRKSAVRRAAVVTVVAVGIESLIGAGLVKAELVGDNSSLARVVVVALHLANTLLLTASAALTAWYAEEGLASPNLSAQTRRYAIVVGLGLVLVSTTGAVTALGDTLFHPAAVSTGSDATHFLVKLRIVHPSLAALVGLGVVGFARSLRNAAEAAGARAYFFCRALEWLVWLQLGIGLVSVAVGAPGWLQLVHLLFAQLVWLCFVLLCAPALLARARLDLVS